MSKVWILIKNEAKLFFNRLNKTSKGKKRGTSVILIIGILVLAGYLGAQGYFMLDLLKNTGAERMVIDQQVMTLFIFSIVFIINNGLSVSEKDSDFLLSLPIKRWQIVLSKTALKYLFDLIISLIVLFPISVMYFIMIERKVSIILFSLLVCVIASFAFVGLEYLVNSLVNGVALRFKYFNVVKTILSTIVLVGFIVLYEYMITQMQSAGEIVPRYIVFSYISDIIVQGKVINLVILAFVSALTLLLGVKIFANVYGKKNKTYKTQNTTLKPAKNKSIYATLIKKELKTYFGSSAYLFNTIIGYIILMGAPIALFFVEAPQELLSIIVYAICAFSLSTCCISNSSISLEGKNVWIFKSSPIDYKKIVYAKAITNYILVLISGTVSFIILLIANKFTLAFSLLMYALVLASGLVISFYGVIINLIFPKLDYENEMRVVKQSASVLVSMLCFMVIFMAFPIILFVLSLKGRAVNVNLFAITNVGFLLLLTLLAIVFIEKKAYKLFSRL